MFQQVTFETFAFNIFLLNTNTITFTLLEQYFRPPYSCLY